MSTSVHAFQNQTASLIEEELALLRGVDDYYARPVYNRLFWNFTKGEGEAAYATNYNVTDINQDGFIDEDDAMLLFPQGHGDAWGHYLTALRNQYDLLRHPYFNWVSRSESYNLQDIVIGVDFFDERKFAAAAAAKAKAGAEIVALTYRDKLCGGSQRPVAGLHRCESRPGLGRGGMGAPRRPGRLFRLGHRQRAVAVRAPEYDLGRDPQGGSPEQLPTSQWSPPTSMPSNARWIRRTAVTTRSG